MLKRASVADVRNGTVTKEDGLLVVAMRVYPRFLARALVSEYAPGLAPAPELFERYRKLKSAGGNQNQAFEAAGYQHLFALEDVAFKELGRLVEGATGQDVFLICQCRSEEMCHVDLLLLMAEQRFGAEIAALADEYPLFRRRLSLGSLR